MDPKKLREEAAEKALAKSPTQQRRDDYESDRATVEAGESYGLRAKKRLDEWMSQKGLTDRDIDVLYAREAAQKWKLQNSDANYAYWNGYVDFYGNPGFAIDKGTKEDPVHGRTDPMEFVEHTRRPLSDDEKALKAEYESVAGDLAAGKAAAWSKSSVPESAYRESPLGPMGMRGAERNPYTWRAHEAAYNAVERDKKQRELEKTARAAETYKGGGVGPTED